ncbi:hypothetical protein AMATHDRAFT_149123 [Amanita thiersii Skay4041]|uniref:THUMP domain-containing protein n=1 Tax=Amanita thiersii Skay4041 TaxID=703135 RepID=A0A2A9NFA3_9AGAR|nr:hypothetical protein AMATHDRAFT_149123 [Amanita thiersii Skay4041]
MRLCFVKDGTPVWTKPHVDGPGVWASCIKGKEKGTVGELYDLFESLAEELWPVENPQDDETTKADASPNDQGDLSLEEKIANEVSTIKKPKRGSRFVNCQTNTQCVVFISCKPPVDPVELVLQHVKNVKETGIARTRYTHRLVPVSDTCVANPPEIQSLCQRVFEPFFSKNPDKKYTYKIELRVRNHTTMQRMDLIQTIALCVPQGHTVSLTEPDIFILVEVFKSTCGVSVVEDYYKLAKFNVVELANMHNKLEPTTAE